ncbi:MAG TPA: hypothetical protein VLT59_03075 [Steroidobacteraceae bacterium]|nr:hypothetical protein [Steroidobacteraceae bacterium]
MDSRQRETKCNETAGLWTGSYLERRGTGRGEFSERLQRARLLHLRRRELAWNWLALLVLVGCWDLADRLDHRQPGADRQLQGSAVAAANDQAGCSTAAQERRSCRTI